MGRLAVRFSNRAVFAAGNVILGLCVASLFVMPSGLVWLMYVVSGVAGAVRTWRCGALRLLCVYSVTVAVCAMI